jgi:hypothetical protein
VRSRVAVSALLAAGVLLGSTGCAFISPVATQIPYDPSDGVGTTVGDVKVRNAMAITADGDTVNLVMYVLNASTEPVEVRFEYNFEGEDPAQSSDGENSETFEFAPGESISFGNSENNEDAPTLILENVDVEPGSLMPLFVQYGEETGKTMLVPVLDEAIYADLVPEPVVPRTTSTPSPSSSSTPSDAPTPLSTPTGEPTPTTTETPGP